MCDKRGYIPWVATLWWKTENRKRRWKSLCVCVYVSILFIQSHFICVLVTLYVKSWMQVGICMCMWKIISLWQGICVCLCVFFPCAATSNCLTLLTQDHNVNTGLKCWSQMNKQHFLKEDLDKQQMWVKDSDGRSDSFHSADSFELIHVNASNLSSFRSISSL